jgi:hypothetical protein
MIVVENDLEVAAIGAMDSADKLARLLTLLCGETVSLSSLSDEARATIDQIVQRIGDTALTHAQFNELLLLFNQDRVGRPFFKFFFFEADGAGAVNAEGFKRGVSRFRAFAMLCFGNFRFAFRRLSTEREPARLAALLEPWALDADAETLALTSRQPPLVSLTGTPDHIPAEKTWLLGYLSSQSLSADEQALDEFSNAAESAGTTEAAAELRSLLSELQDLNGAIVVERAKGRRNTVKYLTWDYLDVYVATSMRQRWEFEQTFRLVEKVFQEQLADLPRIRWFDPTQAYSESIIDKGLVEALMLKRAKCTIYMVQESDTFGKDSELAATLAQGKPVIAYVPRTDTPEALAELVTDVSKLPVNYFRQRLLSLSAEGFFDRRDNRLTVSSRTAELGLEMPPDDLKSKVQQVLQLVAQFDKDRRFLVIGNEQARFQEQHKSAFEEARKLLAAIESVAADGRAATIKSRHPLGMQVHLETGVANGVLVARSPQECATLIRSILTRRITFDIEHVIERDRLLGTALVDKSTRSRFRFVTADECISNSFWNFYLERAGRSVYGKEFTERE